MKPILFNTEMVQAIMEGRKTVTRRLIKPRYKPKEMGIQIVTNAHTGKLERIEFLDEYGRETRCMAWPFFWGDIFYVRETWAEMPYGYVYKADGEEPEGWDSSDRWHPSIHMPKEAARLFLRVTDVRVERLQKLTEAQALAEGVPNEWPMPAVYCPYCKGEGLIEMLDSMTLGVTETDCPFCEDAIRRFANLWNSTIRTVDLHQYSFEANPWVWVIEFERCEKPEGADVQ